MTLLPVDTFIARYFLAASASNYGVLEIVSLTHDILVLAASDMQATNANVLYTAATSQVTTTSTTFTVNSLSGNPSNATAKLGTRAAAGDGITLTAQSNGFSPIECFFKTPLWVPAGRFITVQSVTANANFQPMVTFAEARARTDGVLRFDYREDPALIDYRSLG